MSAEQERDFPQLDRVRTHFHVLMGSQQYVVVKHAHVWRPPTDVMEDGERLYIVVELAGMRDGEIHVALGPQRVVISGMRTTPRQTCTAYHQLEIRYGEFRTEVALPWPVDENGIEASYEDGFLRVKLVRASAEHVRVIPVDKNEVLDARGYDD